MATLSYLLSVSLRMSRSTATSPGILSRSVQGRVSVEWTIIQAQAAHYPGVLRQMLGIPESKLVLVGIAIGCPDWQNPINGFRSERETVQRAVKWYGFD